MIMYRAPKTAAAIVLKMSVMVPGSRYASAGAASRKVDATTIRAIFAIFVFVFVFIVFTAIQRVRAQKQPT